MKYILNNGIINFDDVRESMNKAKREEILSTHPYDIWESSDGRIRTYVRDDTNDYFATGDPDRNLVPIH